MASVGAAKASIAKREGVSKSTLDKILERDSRAKEAFEAGRGELQTELVGSLFRQATRAKNPNTIAAIFLLKSMCNFIDNPQPKPEEARVTVQLVIPRPLAREDFERLVASTPQPKRLPQTLETIDVESQEGTSA